MNTYFRQSLAWLALGVAIAASSAPALASEEQRLIDEARVTVEELLADPNLTALPGLLARSRGALVVPALVKAGFIIGGEGGSGVLLARAADSGDWSYPAFYTMASGSFGLQIGVQVSKVVFLIMTEGGFKKLMSDKLTLGVDVSVAAGPVGAGLEASSTLNVEVDIYSFAHAKGLFGGISFEGSVLVPDEEANEAYYGEAVSSRGIVIHRKTQNPGADALRAALAAR